MLKNIDQIHKDKDISLSCGDVVDDILSPAEARCTISTLHIVHILHIMHILHTAQSALNFLQSGCLTLICLWGLGGPPDTNEVISVNLQTNSYIPMQARTTDPESEPVRP